MAAIARRPIALALASVAAASLGLAACSSGAGGSNDETSGPVTLTWFQGSGVDTNIKTAQGLADAFHAKNPDITVKVDASGPSGPELDGVMKTRLATGEMPDMFWYNSGSLLQTLSPDTTMLNIKDEPFVKNLDDAWISSVSTDEGVYGVPVQSAGGGGMFYNIPLYEKVGIEVPTTGTSSSRTPRRSRTQATSRSSRPTATLDLPDHHPRRLLQHRRERQDWAAKYTENKVNFADDPVAKKSFTKLQDLHDGGFLNEDFASAKLDDGLKAVATGTAANYPMLGFAQGTIATNFPDNVNDVGFFGIPGETADKNGITVWEPPALYARPTPSTPTR